MSSGIAKKRSSNLSVEIYSTGEVMAGTSSNVIYHMQQLSARHRRSTLIKLQSNALYHDHLNRQVQIKGTFIKGFHDLLRISRKSYFRIKKDATQHMLTWRSSSRESYKTTRSQLSVRARATRRYFEPAHVANVEKGLKWWEIKWVPFDHLCSPHTKKMCTSSDHRSSRHPGASETSSPMSSTARQPAGNTNIWSSCFKKFILRANNLEAPVHYVAS